MTDQQSLCRRVQAIREGGHTERAHTIPHHGGYSVAAHTWNVVALILLLHPNPSLELVKAAMFHDVAERYAGDIPGHAKYWHSPALGNIHEQLEKKLEIRMGIVFSLTWEERRWLKGCDLLEFYMWCHDQEALGNRHVEHVKTNVLLYIEENPLSMPPQIIDFINKYQWERTHDNGYWNE